MAHEPRYVPVTAAQYAKLINRSIWTARRRARAMAKQGLAWKQAGGHWLIVVDAREFKAALVQEIRTLGSRIKSTPWNKPIAHLTGRREHCNEMLIALGASDILIELDRARANVGIPTAKSRTEYKLALAAIERMIAA